jgi:hypothetical protein
MRNYWHRAIAMLDSMPSNLVRGVGLKKTASTSFPNSSEGLPFLLHQAETAASVASRHL